MEETNSELMSPKVEVVFCEPDINGQCTIEGLTKRKGVKRNANPNSWKCNIKKQKHQRGEAYYNRRGKYVPEKRVLKVSCSTSCLNHCNDRFTYDERQSILKAYYALDFLEKKYFLLNTTERCELKYKKVSISSRRKYTFQYSFLKEDIRYKVCKNFYLATLSISQKTVYNVHLKKTEENVPKCDGRGASKDGAHSISKEVRDRVIKHILTFKTHNFKPLQQYSKKKQYLDPCMTIRTMFLKYASDCEKDNVVGVKESTFRMILKQDFNIHFKHKRFELLSKNNKVSNNEK